MIKKLWDYVWSIYHKYEEGLNYLIFGGLAFVVNYLVYAVCVQGFGWDYQVGNVVSWIVAVCFAYWTNRTFVFKSKVKDTKGLGKEMSSFVSARIATLVMEIVVMWLFVDILGIHDMIAKLIGQALVIITNYGVSKTIIFRKDKE